MKEIIHQLFVLLGFVYELSAEEKLDAIVSEHKHRSLLDDILRIRRSGDYVPNYNRQRLHTEYQLIKKDGSVINMDVITTCPRPVDFGTDLEKWLFSIHKENADTVELKRLKKLQDIQRREVFETQFSPQLMERFLKVN